MSLTGIVFLKALPLQGTTIHNDGGDASKKNTSKNTEIFAGAEHPAKPQQDGWHQSVLPGLVAATSAAPDCKF